MGLLHYNISHDFQSQIVPRRKRFLYRVVQLSSKPEIVDEVSHIAFTQSMRLVDNSNLSMYISLDYLYNQFYFFH